jgi:transcriptional regulator GlxA family with amidase domain
MAVASVTDLARRANTSVRSLEEGFRAHLGTTPMRYLRDVRLAHAHEALRRGDPEATTATAIAHRWGFNHYGRFASQYRVKFGRTPGETLRSGEMRYLAPRNSSA